MYHNVASQVGNFPFLSYVYKDVSSIYLYYNTPPYLQVFSWKLQKYFRIYLAISCFKNWINMQFQIMAIVKLQKWFCKYNVPNFKNSTVCWPSACISDFEHPSFCMDKGSGLLNHSWGGWETCCTTTQWLSLTIISQTTLRNELANKSLRGAKIKATLFTHCCLDVHSLKHNFCQDKHFHSWTFNSKKKIQITKRK